MWLSLAIFKRRRNGDKFTEELELSNSDFKKSDLFQSPSLLTPKSLDSQKIESMSCAHHTVDTSICHPHGETRIVNSSAKMQNEATPKVRKSCLKQTIRKDVFEEPGIQSISREVTEVPIPMQSSAGSVGFPRLFFLR